jgi:hypothetical protein
LPDLAEVFFELVDELLLVLFLVFLLVVVEHFLERALMDEPILVLLVDLSLGRAFLTGGAFLFLHEVHLTDLLENLKQVYAVVGVAVYDLFSLDMAHVEM